MKKYFWTAVVLVVVWCGSASAQPWPGVPQPAFGVNEVSPTAAGGPMPGSHVLTPGTIVRLSGPQPAFVSPNNITANCTAAAPCWIIGGDGLIADISGSYVIVEKGSWSRLGLAGDHLVARNGICTGGNYAYCITLQGSQLVVHGNSIHDNGDLNTTTDQDVHGVTISQPSDHVWVQANKLFRNSGDGVQVNANALANTEQVHHIYIAGNWCVHNRQTCAWSKYATSVVVSSNACAHARPDAGGINPGACFGGQYDSVAYTIINNRMSDADYGIRLSSYDDGSVGGTLIAGNVCFNVHATHGFDVTNDQSSGACYMLRGGGSRLLLHNTVAGADIGIEEGSTTPTVAIDNAVVGAAAGATDSTYHPVNTVTTATFAGTTNTGGGNFTVTSPLGAAVYTDISTLDAAYAATHGVPTGLTFAQVGAGNSATAPIDMTEPPPGCTHDLPGFISLLQGTCVW